MKGARGLGIRVALGARRTHVLSALATAGVEPASVVTKRSAMLQAPRALAHHFVVVKRPERLVYASDSDGLCPRCGWPANDCRCASAADRTEDDPVPARITVKLRIERTGRGGKTVTVIDGIPRNTSFAAALAQDLKRSCGTG